MIRLDDLRGWSLRRRSLSHHDQRALSQWVDAQRRSARGVVLSTCERVEVYSEGDSKTPPVGSGLRLAGASMVHHLFRVAAGADSRLVGESAIVSQIRNAADEAQLRIGLGAALTTVVRAALRAGRIARAESGLEGVAQSYARVAARAALRGGSLRIGVVGTGALGASTARQIRRLSEKRVSVVIFGRHHARTAALAESINASSAPLSALRSGLRHLDSLVSAVSVSHPILGVGDLEATTGIRVIDLGSPGNVDPRVASISGVERLDIDDLMRGIDPSDSARAQLDMVVERETQRFLSYMDSASTRHAPRIWSARRDLTALEVA